MTLPLADTSCKHYNDGSCQSCSWLPEPYLVQLARKQEQVQHTLEDFIDVPLWESPHASAPWQFRNQAKLVVGGTRGDVTLGILDDAKAVTSLTDCPLYVPAIADLLPQLEHYINGWGLTPYSVPHRTGELKNILVLASPADTLMVRFVLRSEGQLRKLAQGAASLVAEHPAVTVVTANLQPDHTAVLAGPEDTRLHGPAFLPMPLGPVQLQLAPGAFWQTNTDVATALYAAAAEWTACYEPEHILDLYCGTGGFAYTITAGSTAAWQPVVHGVEIVEASIAGARHAASAFATDHPHATPPTFTAAPARSLADPSALRGAVIVNPPRRGLDTELVDALVASNCSHLLYSSCNPTTLARDLARLPTFTARRAQLFDMFPHTPHAEVLVALTRT